MSAPNANSDDFEAAAQGSPEQVADFDHHDKGVVGRIQH